MSPKLLDIEQSIQALSTDEKLWLLERIVHQLRKPEVNDSDAATHRQQVREVLVNAGLSSSSPPSSTSAPISAERREELAKLFSKGGSLSELIIEEREGR